MARHSGDSDPKETPGSYARAENVDSLAEMDREPDQSPERIAADVEIIDRAYGDR